MKIINVEGGLGRAIAFSSILEKIGLKEKIGVVTMYDFLFETNPNVICYDASNKNIFEETIKENEYIYCEPYTDIDFYKNKEHICTVINKIITGEKEFIKPKIYEHPVYIKRAEDWINLQKQNNKKIMFIQPFSSTGGNKDENGNEIEDISYRSLKEDFVKKIVNEFKEEYNIFLVKDNSQFCVDETINYTLEGIEDYFLFYSICKRIDVAICCDSFLPHLLEAVDSQAKVFVLWGATSEKNFGYDGHYHIRKKEVEFIEPLRMPCNPVFYQIKNHGLNDFGDKEIEQIKEKL